jgi:lipopolysaccharide transport system permease protein
VVNIRVDPQRIDLVRTLVWRQLVLRYRRSLLGIAWSQLGPLALLGVIAFVFSVVVPLDIPNYALFVIVGLLSWTWFASGITAATESVVESRDLVRLPGFPATMLPVVAVATHLMHFLLALPVLLVVILVVQHGLSVTLVALPLVLGVQFLVTLAPAYLLAAVNVRYRDVGHLVGVALLPLFYASPVFYGLAQVPERYHWVYDVNPFAHLLKAYRDVLLVGNWPDWAALATVAGIAAVVAVLCRRQFRSTAPTFAELL